MARYRMKPVETDAVQLRWTQWNEVCELLGHALKDENPDGAWEIQADEVSDTCGEEGPNYIALIVRTAHGEIAVVRHGDWIIPDGKPGTFYPCKPDIFAATYEAVTPGPAPTEQEKTARVLSALHRSAEQDVTRIIDLYEQWVKAGPPPLGTLMARWWDARLVELRNAIRPPSEQATTNEVTD